MLNLISIPPASHKNSKSCQSNNLTDQNYQTYENYQSVWYYRNYQCGHFGHVCVCTPHRDDGDQKLVMNNGQQRSWVQEYNWNKNNEKAIVVQRESKFFFFIKPICPPIVVSEY